jgi:hypothetical protein
MTASAVWDIDKPQKSETGHSTQKPVECMKRPIENNSKPGDAVYEPFSGSGTTIIAAEMTGRRCLAVDITLQDACGAIAGDRFERGLMALVQARDPVALGRSREKWRVPVRAVEYGLGNDVALGCFQLDRFSDVGMVGNAPVLNG